VIRSRLARQAATFSLAARLLSPRRYRRGAVRTKDWSAARARAATCSAAIGASTSRPTRTTAEVAAGMPRGVACVLGVCGGEAGDASLEPMEARLTARRTVRSTGRAQSTAPLQTARRRRYRGRRPAPMASPATPRSLPTEARRKTGPGDGRTRQRKRAELRNRRGEWQRRPGGDAAPGDDGPRATGRRLPRRTAGGRRRRELRRRRRWWRRRLEQRRRRRRQRHRSRDLPFPFAMCGGNCIDTSGDALNCGMCGKTCVSQICQDSQCVGTTSGGLIFIGHDFEGRRRTRRRKRTSSRTPSSFRRPILCASSVTSGM